MLIPKEKSLTWPILIGIALLTLLVYLPGLNGDFLFDDYPNIVKDESIHIQTLDLDSLRQAAFAVSAGPLGRPVSRLSFAVNYAFFGLDPYYFKLVNLFIHIINGIGIFLLSKLLLQLFTRRFDSRLEAAEIRGISLLVAALWLLHPLNLSSVLYVVQRMNSLTALFTIYGLIAYCLGRLRLLESERGVWISLSGIALGTLLAALSKENGLLLPLFAFAIEFLLLGFQAHTRRLQITVKALWACFFFAFTAAFLWFLNTGIIPASYADRPFTLEQRLLTESRIVSDYIGLTLVPNITRMSMFHDDIQVSTGILAPGTTLPSLLFILGSLFSAFILRKKLPLLSLGIVFFFIGHLLESTVIGLELKYEHRNYLPMFGLLFALTASLFPRLQRRTTTRAAVFAVLVALLGAGTFIRATSWSSHLDFALTEARHKPLSARAQYTAAVAYAELSNDLQQGENRKQLLQLAQTHFQNSALADPNSFVGLFGLIRFQSLNAMPIAPATIEELAKRLRNKRLGSSTPNQFEVLVACICGDACDIPQEQMDTIFSAAIENPTDHGVGKSIILHEAAKYQHCKADNPEKSRSLLYRSIKAAPGEITPRISLINILILLDDRNEAKRQLQELQKVNTLRRFSDQIKPLEEALR